MSITLTPLNLFRLYVKIKKARSSPSGNWCTIGFCFETNTLPLIHWRSSRYAAFDLFNVCRRREVVRSCCKVSPAPEWYDAYFPMENSTLWVAAWLKHLAATRTLVTDDLRWTNHMQKISGRASKMTYLLERGFRGCSPKSRCTLHKTYIRPSLEFARPVWCPIFQLESLQRWMTRLPYARLVMMGLTTFASRRVRGDLIVTFSVLHHKFDCDLSSFFPIIHNVNLWGHKYKLCEEKFSIFSQIEYSSFGMDYLLMLWTVAQWMVAKTQCRDTIAINLNFWVGIEFFSIFPYKEYIFLCSVFIFSQSHRNRPRPLFIS